MTNNSSIQEVLFFPQMKPEKKALDLTEEEKAVLKILKDAKELPLDMLKEQSGLSNKKWDKAIKGLTKQKIAKVEKTDDALTVTFIE